MTDLTRAEIRGFLRSRRARLEPTLREIAADPRPRRVAGLRREEVATRAAVSLDYYIQLERGQVRGVSASVLTSVMDALELDEVERRYLADLVAQLGTRGHGADDQAVCRAGAPASAAPEASAAPQPLPAGLAEMVAAMTGVAVALRNHRMDLLAANTTGHALYRWVADVPGANLARHVALDRRSREQLYPDFAEVADFAAGTLRASLASHPHDPRLRALLDDLLQDEDFAGRWARHPVLRFGSGVQRFADPEVGLMRLAHTQFVVREQPELVVTVFRPADEQSRAAFGRLDALVPEQESPPATRGG